MLTRYAKMVGLLYMIANIATFRHELFIYLGATYTSVITNMLDITLSRAQTEVYLNPVRDMPEHELWIREKVRNGMWVTLVGRDLYLLMDRIIDPIAYFKKHGTGVTLVVWLAAVDPSRGISKTRDSFEFGFMLAPMPTHPVTDGHTNWIEYVTDPRNGITLLHYGPSSGWNSYLYASTESSLFGKRDAGIEANLILTERRFETRETSGYEFLSEVSPRLMVMTAYINMHIDPFTAIKATPEKYPITHSWWHNDTITMTNFHARGYFDCDGREDDDLFELALHIPLTNRGVYAKMNSIGTRLVSRGMTLG